MSDAVPVFLNEIQCTPVLLERTRKDSVNVFPIRSRMFVSLNVLKDTKVIRSSDSRIRSGYRNAQAVLEFIVPANECIGLLGDGDDHARSSVKKAPSAQAYNRLSPAAAKLVPRCEMSILPLMILLVPAKAVDIADVASRKQIMQLP